MMKVCFATNNSNKLSEIKDFLKDSSYEILSLSDIGCHADIPETSDTIEGNSLLKARYVFDRYNIACFADDTGLEVAAINGEPGVRSARFAGDQRSAEDNNRLLLEKLKNKQDRSARFKTVITWISDKEIKQFTGMVEGTIVDTYTGDKGFGYDPLFKPAGFDKTFAQMSMAEKNTISHRALATGKLIDYLTLQKNK
ncbi:MAG: non-canonical purine NTP diphosphatase [Cyclobacteriaceae bacterium]